MLIGISLGCLENFEEEGFQGLDNILKFIIRDLHSLVFKFFRKF